MKASRLIEILQEYDPDKRVILASDPEGNGFYTGIEVGVAVVPAGPEYRLESINNDLAEIKEELEEWGEEFDPNDYEEVLVLWP